jgi:uncharacterized damage-inducible protein DinB
MAGIAPQLPFFDAPIGTKGLTPGGHFEAAPAAKKTAVRPFRKRNAVGRSARHRSSRAHGVIVKHWFGDTMNLLRIVVAASLFSGIHAFAAGTESIATIQDHMLSQVEKEVVSLAEAMPANKYDFAPKQGSFEGVRTFGQQMSHIATALDMFSAMILGEKRPDGGPNENGPASLHGKDDIVKYLKTSFTNMHTALQSLTPANYTNAVGKTTRGALAIESVSHTFDHYGQAVVYARMNGIVPPASRKS